MRRIIFCLCAVFGFIGCNVDEPELNYDWYKPVFQCGNYRLDDGEACDFTAGTAIFRDYKSCKELVPGSVGALQCSRNCQLDLRNCFAQACDNTDASYCARGQLVKCANGKWSFESCGYNSICSDGARKCSAIQCRYNGRECLENGDVSMVLECRDDHKVKLTRCEEGYVCDFAKGECVLRSHVCDREGDYRCVADDGKGDILEVCDGGHWLKSKHCNVGETCDVSLKGCSKACVDGDSKCIEGDINICEKGRWKSLGPCTPDSICYAGRCEKVCNDGYKECSSDGLLLSCYQGVLIQKRACRSGYVCRLGESECRVVEGCKEGLKRCGLEGEMEQIEVCESGGVWKVEKRCAVGEKCKSGERFKCEEGEVKKCSKDECLEGVFRKCENGFLGHGEPCDSGKCNTSQDACLVEESEWDYCEKFSGDPLPSKEGSGKFKSVDVPGIQWSYQNLRKASTSWPIDGFGAGTPSNKAGTKSSISAEIQGNLAKVGLKVRSASSSTLSRLVSVKVGGELVGHHGWSKEGDGGKTKSLVYHVKVNGKELYIEHVGVLSTIDDICWKLKK